MHTTKALIVLASISLFVTTASAFVIPCNTVPDMISATSDSQMAKPAGLEALPHSSILLSGLETSIDFEHNPGQSFGTLILLAYIGISVAAGLKYIFVDGWRPKL